MDQLGGIVLEVHGGDIVFIPAGWWHAATNITDTIAWGDCVINFSNIKAVMSCYRERQEEFEKVCLDIKQLLEVMAEKATTYETIATLLSSLELDLDEFASIKKTLQRNMRSLMR
jgi:ribosomal protein L16 Arg81 hydroxylase